MKITQEQIEKVYSLYGELDKIKEIASELLRTAQDRYNDVEVELEREGKMIKIAQRHLWEEVYQLGRNCQASEVLSNLYPDIFKAFGDQDKIIAEIKSYMTLEFGIDYQSVKMSDIFKLTEAMVELKLSQMTK